MSNMAAINYENAEEQKTHSAVEVFFIFSFLLLVIQGSFNAVHKHILAVHTVK